MPLVSIKLKPGLNSVQTPTLNELGWVSGSNIRFFQGLPQKDAGYVELFSDIALGIIRALKAWQALNGTKYLGVASEGNPAADKLSIWDGSTVTDVTPVGAGVSGLATMDNFGEFLMTCFGGPIFVWVPPSGAATAIATAPPENGFIFVALKNRCSFPVRAGCGERRL